MTVDDHPIFRDGLAALLSIHGDLQLAAEADDEAIRSVHRGGRVLPPPVAQRLAEFTPRIELTERELEVLGLKDTSRS